MHRHRWNVGRGTLRHILPALLLFSAPPVQADDVDRWRPMIEEASTRFGIPTRWIGRVIRAESRGRTMLNGQPIRSRAGAIGLMQLMPATWAEMRSRLGLGDDPDDPRDNILAGTFYLRLMYDRFGYPGLFGAYNAGPGAYAAYLAGKRPLPRETLAYLESVGGTSRAALLPAQWPQPPALFLIRHEASISPSSNPTGDRQALLFAVRKVGP